MHDHKTKTSLSPARRQLLERLQALNFGQVVDLAIRNGEPDLSAARARREIKFGGDNGSRPELVLRDFALKDAHRELFALFDRLSDGVIESLEVRNGLPCRLTLREPL